jgi:hypothetical protein
MRARRGLIVGWVSVVAYAALLAGVTLVAVADRSDRPAPAPAPTSDNELAEQFVAAWERSRLATFVASGTYERRSLVTGAAIASDDVVVQRPPRRLHRQLGGVEGRDDDRLLVCPAPPEGEEEDAEPCRLGAPGGRSYAASVANEVAGLRSLTQGAGALYRVTAGAPGCFDLDLVRIDPRAPFGVEASFCFDPATGAPSGSRVRHEGGIEEVVVVTDIRTDVTDADLTP